MKELSLNKAKNLVRELVKKKEFPESEAVLFQKLLWAFVELGEATDAFKKGEEWEIVAEELMDAVFYILDFLGLVEKTQGIQLDLDNIFLKKWKQNMQRPNHYGLRKDIPYSDGIIPAPPKKLTIEIIKKCFNKCVFCSAYVSEEDAEKVLTLKDAKSIIDQFVRLGGKELNISGGEPLLHPNWFEIANYAKSKGLAVKLFSCGIFSEKPASHDEISSIIEKISKVGFSSIEMTLHAPNSTMHDEITGMKGSFRTTFHFIKRLSPITNNVEINFVPMQINSDELEEVVDLVVSLGISRVNILRFIPQGRGLVNKDWLSLKIDQSARLIKAASQLSKREDICVSLGHPSDFIFLLDELHKPDSCSAGKEQCMIQINGDVIPCPAFGDMPEWVAGNVFNHNLDSIWKESPVFVRLREFDYRRMQGDCKFCSYLELCQGRCPAQRIRENRDLYKGPDLACPKNYI